MMVKGMKDLSCGRCISKKEEKPMRLKLHMNHRISVDHVEGT